MDRRFPRPPPFVSTETCRLAATCDAAERGLAWGLLLTALVLSLWAACGNAGGLLVVVECDAGPDAAQGGDAGGGCP